MIKNGRPGEIYNIGGGVELTNLQLADKILSIFGNDKSKIEFVPDRLGHDTRYSVDFTKIKKELEYSPTIGFDIGIMETVEFYKERLDWWEKLKP